MNIHQILSIISGVIYAISACFYLASIVQRQTQPNIASIVIWTLMSVSLLISLIVSGVWTVVPFVLVGLTSGALTVALSLKHNNFYLKRLDKIALILGLVGVLVWVLTKNADYNIYISMLVDIIGFTPIIVKVWQKPNLEAKVPWLINFIGACFLMAAIPKFEMVYWIVPAVQIIGSGAVNLGINFSKAKPEIKPVTSAAIARDY